MNVLDLADLTCEPIIAKKAQDNHNIGVCSYLPNHLIDTITPESMADGVQRLYNIENYEDNFMTSWQDDHNNLNKMSEVQTAIIRHNSKYNSAFSYEKYGVATIKVVHYISKDQQDREQDAEIDNNPLADDGTYWKRGIKDSELLSQRFNLWDVSMSGTTITLTSTSDFDDYLFKSSQLVNGLMLSFIPTQDGAGYGAGSSYTITIDGVSKKLFENIDETLAGNGKCIKQGQPVKIYYNASADNGNGAFFVFKYNSLADKNFIGKLNNTNKTITLSGRNAEQTEYLNNLTARDLYVGFELKFVPNADTVALTAGEYYTLIINSTLSVTLKINYFNGNLPSCKSMLKANNIYTAFIATSSLTTACIKEFFNNEKLLLFRQYSTSEYTLGTVRIYSTGRCVQSFHIISAANGNAPIKDGNFLYAFKETPLVFSQRQASTNATDYIANSVRNKSNTHFQIYAEASTSYDILALGYIDLNLL